MSKLLTVVVPSKDYLTADNITLKSLAKQTFQDFRIVIKMDLECKGAPWARNQGFKYCNTDYVLFCDDDIDWKPEALEIMVQRLRDTPGADYCYCGYTMEGTLYCTIEFDPERLRCLNYISTMSVLRTTSFPGFDENIKRLQDWDLWLQLLKVGKVGVWCGQVLFDTKKRLGLTFGNNTTYDQAKDIVKEKHFGCQR